MGWLAIPKALRRRRPEGVNGSSRSGVYSLKDGGTGLKCQLRYEIFFKQPIFVCYRRQKLAEIPPGHGNILRWSLSHTATQQKNPLYINDGSFRVFLVPTPKNICSLYTNVGTNRVLLVPPAKNVFQCYILLTADFALSSYRQPKIFSSLYMYVGTNPVLRASVPKKFVLLC